MKQVWEYRTEELAEMYAIAQCEIERLNERLNAAIDHEVELAQDNKRLRAALNEIKGWFERGDDAADIKAYAIACKALNEQNARQQCAECTCDNPPDACNWIKPARR